MSLIRLFLGRYVDKGQFGSLLLIGADQVLIHQVTLCLFLLQVPVCVVGGDGSFVPFGPGAHARMAVARAVISSLGERSRHVDPLSNVSTHGLVPIVEVHHGSSLGGESSLSCSLSLKVVLQAIRSTQSLRQLTRLGLPHHVVRRFVGGLVKALVSLSKPEVLFKRVSWRWMQESGRVLIKGRPIISCLMVARRHQG